MFAKLISVFARWIGHEAEEATYHAIKSGSQRGAQRALAELTGGEVDASQLLTVDARQQALEELSAHSQEIGCYDDVPPHLEAGSPPALPPLTRSAVHKMNRAELTATVNERGLDVDLGGTVKDIRADVFAALEI